MRLFTSYFYKIRFFKPWQVPISTALWDPKWFHAFKSQDYKFLDKNHVINGLRCESLHPDHTCQDLCRGQETCKCKDPTQCQFLKNYRTQLQNLDKAKILEKFQALADRIEKTYGHEADIVLIVHEPPYKACSERSALQEAFHCTELDV